MIHLDRAQLGLMSIDTTEVEKAISEYKQAIAMAMHVDPRDYFRMGEGYKLVGKYDDSIAAFSKASELSSGRMKQLADAEVARVKQLKAQAAAPAKP